MIPPPPRSTLFPYTTLFRSDMIGDRFLQIYQEEHSTEAAPEVVARVWGVAKDLGYPKYFRSEEHTSELQSRSDLVCRLLLEKKKNIDRKQPLLKQQQR